MNAFKKYKLGFSGIGLLAFVMQEFPYLLRALFPLVNDPLVGNAPANGFFGALEGVGGVLTVALLLLVVRKEPEKPSVKDGFFIAAAGLLGLYYACFIAYLAGATGELLIVLGLSAPVPLYYLCVAVWRKNCFAAATATVFFMGHTLSNAINYL
jgi:hypothetical protein